MFSCHTESILPMRRCLLLLLLFLALESCMSQCVAGPGYVRVGLVEQKITTHPPSNNIHIISCIHLCLCSPKNTTICVCECSSVRYYCSTPSSSPEQCPNGVVFYLFCKVFCYGDIINTLFIDWLCFSLLLSCRLHLSVFIVLVFLRSNLFLLVFTFQLCHVFVSYLNSQNFLYGWVWYCQCLSLSVYKKYPFSCFLW